MNEREQRAMDQRNQAVINLTAENSNLRTALQKVIEHDQTGGWRPEFEKPRHEPGFKIETYDGECAKIARAALEPQASYDTH